MQAWHAERKLKLVQGVASAALWVYLSNKLWVCCLELLKLNEQAVKFSVGQALDYQGA